MQRSTSASATNAPFKRDDMLHLQSKSGQKQTLLAQCTR